jgi:hypothetical protein
VILPAQALLEFWNNRVSGIIGLGDRLRKSFDELSDLISSLDPTYVDFANGARSLMNDFHSHYGHVLEETVANQVETLLDSLADKAIIPQVELGLLDEVAEQRRAAKIPPGFKDPGVGDLLLWIEFLHGLQIARKRGEPFDGAILVTDDNKSDWSTKGTAHPTLYAEVAALVDVPFDIWTLNSLQDWVAESLDVPPSSDG